MPSRRPAVHVVRALRAASLALAAAMLIAGALAVPAQAAGKVHYLSSRGSDGASGSKAHPWRSLYVSLHKLHPGDTLYIRGGHYAFRGINYTGLAGTAAHRIVIRNYPGETPIFTGTGAPAAFLYFDGNAAYLTISGLTVQGGGVVATTKGSSLLGFEGNAHSIRIASMRLLASSGWTRDQHLAYIASASVHDIVFASNTLDGRGCICAGLLHFYHDPNAARITVTGNTFRNADQAIVIWANVSGLRIDGNRFLSTRIAVRHHNSGGTAVTNNRGTKVSIGIYADSKANLTQSGNAW